MSHSYSRPAGVQAEVEQGSGTVRLDWNTAGVQQGGSVGLGRRDGVSGVDYCHHSPVWQARYQKYNEFHDIIN